MKLRITMLIILVVMAISTTAFAEFSDVKSDASYYDAVKRLSVFGIMNGDNFNKFNPDSMLTREQFAKIIVVAAGLSDDANSLKGSTVFPDIPSSSWASGYINVAVSKGYLTGMPDGKFHPTDKVTFAQVCTVLVRVLGYTDQDLKGFWPDNYIEKAKIIGLANGVKLQAVDGVPRWTAAVMINSMLSANIKKTNPQEADKTFSQSIDLYNTYIVLANSKTMEKLASNQIMTDKGVFYIDDDISELELGAKYEFYVKDDKITKVYNKLNTMKNYTVISASDTKITYRNDEGNEESYVLPDKTTYYYNGEKQTYDNLKNILQSNTSIIFGENSSKKGYEYALIFDPVYSKPEIGSRLDISKKKIGSISYDDDMAIIRNSTLIKAASIEKYDVCYKITDIWGKNSYILVVDSDISGKIQAFLPNKVTARQLQIDSKTYEFGKDMELGKIRNTTLYNINDEVIVLFGYDGKIIDVLYPDQDTTNYGFVLNYTDATSGDSHIIKLLLPNNTTVSYKTKDANSSYKGTLISYTKIDDEYISVETIPYSTSSQYMVNKDERMIGSNLVTDDVKIFNILSSNVDSDTKVEILNWADMPYGDIPSGRILHVNKSGEFGDINIIVANDLLDQKYRMGVVSKISGGRYSIMVDGKEYSYGGNVTSAQVGTAVIVSMSGGIEAVLGITYSYNKSTVIQAYDSKRIKINDKVYRFRDDMVIYKKGIDDNVTVISKDEMVRDKTYADVSLFLDYNNMVKMILISDV